MLSPARARRVLRGEVNLLAKGKRFGRKEEKEKGGRKERKREGKEDSKNGEVFYTLVVVGRRFLPNESPHHRKHELRLRASSALGNPLSQ